MTWMHDLEAKGLDVNILVLHVIFISFKQKFKSTENKRVYVCAT